MKIPANVLAFSGGKTELYEAFIDYWNHYRHNNGAKNMVFDASKSIDEKEALLNAALRKEILRVANVGDMSAFPIEQWASHPAVNWAMFAVVSSLVDTVLPTSILETTQMYAEVRTGGFGDSFSFEMRPRDLFYISKAGRSQRVMETHKQFNSLVTVIPEPHAATVGVSMPKVLAGKEELAPFVAKLIRSMEESMAREAYTLFNSTFGSLSNTATTGLRVAGFSEESFIDLCQKVTVWSGGAKAIAAGTAKAMLNVLPSDANYRYTLNDGYTTLGYIPQLATYDIMILPQYADWKNPFAANVIADDRIYIFAPSAQKPIKICLEGSTLSNTNNFYENANLTQNTTIWKSWGMGVASSGVGGLIEL